MSRTLRARLSSHFTALSHRHARVPGLRRIPLPSLLIIFLIAVVNLVVWAIVGLILHDHGSLLATAALSYSLGLRHALDADHISAIDLMTRRLLAANPRSRPVTVGTWFSLGHSTIVIITSIVVAGTAAGISHKFSGFGEVGGIIGTAVSAAFLILLGIMNAYILYKLVAQLRKILAMPLGSECNPEAYKVEGGGPLYRVLKQVFRLIDRPWKMYPLGVLFGLGFDTSSEIALLGISSIQASQGTSIWLILVFPVLFTAGMCMIDTIDGALMLAIYAGPMERYGGVGKENFDGDQSESALVVDFSGVDKAHRNELEDGTELPIRNPRTNDPIAFLYYSIVLTSLTVMVAIVIGTIQLLTLILNVATPSGSFWDGVATAGDNYEIIGGSICGSFIVVGGLSVLVYKPWRKRMDERRRVREESEEGSAIGSRGAEEENLHSVEVCPEIQVREERRPTSGSGIDAKGRITAGEILADAGKRHIG